VPAAPLDVRPSAPLHRLESYHGGTVVRGGVRSLVVMTTPPPPGRAGQDGPGPESTPAARPSTVVDLVGAGPGDPDLLTLRAEAALAAATLVVTDITSAHLARAFAPDATVRVSPAGGPDRESIDRGATVDGDTLAVLIGGARAGQQVVRLYRGDPWLHPAYAVESAILASAGIDHVTVPGPLLELSVPALAGIAVHHPPAAATVTIAPSTRLPRASDAQHTLVTIADDADDAGGVTARLARSGDAQLPAAVVVAVGGVPRAVRRGTLGDLARDRTLGGGVVVVGAVAAEITVDVTDVAPHATTVALDPAEDAAGVARGDGADDGPAAAAGRVAADRALSQEGA
jgi:siroheme synthase